ncbi:MAG: hypothetical protein ABR532_08935 [Candidatus Dormibacteria bacterium]
MWSTTGLLSATSTGTGSAASCSPAT